MKTWQELRQEGSWSIAKSMMDVYRLFQDRLADGYARRAFAGLTIAHVHFLAQVNETGTRVSTIAEGLKTTKQYASRLAGELQTKGVIEMVPDPYDRRAVLVRPTERGQAFLEAAAEVRKELEQWFLAKLGPELIQQFAEILSRFTQPI